VKRSNIWYLDSGCSRHMTGDRSRFLSLKSHQGGTVTFGDNQKGRVIGIGKIGISDFYAIDNVYLVDNLKHSLLSISQLCDKGNKVEFYENACLIMNGKTNEVVLKGNRKNNVYICDLNTIPNTSLTCMSAIVTDPSIWHKRFAHINTFTLNKLKKLELVEGLPSIKFDNHKLCDSCIRCKQVRSSFKAKKVVSTSKPLERLHMDLCGPMKVQSRGGYKYVFVIVDDY